MKLKPCIYSFSTFKDNKARTVGLGCLLKDTSHKLNDWSLNQALTINKLFGYNENQYLAAAKGKVFFITTDEDDNTINNSCFQVKNNIAQEVFCGNSTAAASAVICRFLHKNSNIKFKYHCEGACVDIMANVILKDSLVNVSQVWRANMNRAVLKHIKIENCPAVKFNLFNDYVFLKGPIENLEKVIKEGVLSGRIDKKIAIIYPGETLPQVQFYNCNGLHGAAPQTGLASLAILVSKVDWIKNIFPERKLSTPSSIEFLPEIISQEDNNISFIMPDVDVRLSKIF